MGSPLLNMHYPDYPNDFHEIAIKKAFLIWVSQKSAIHVFPIPEESGQSQVSGEPLPTPGAARDAAALLGPGILQGRSALRIRRT